MDKVYKCQAEILSPVHIGSGEKYIASEYVKSKGKSKKGTIYDIIKRIDVSKYFMSLEDDKKDEFLRDLFNPNFDLKNFEDRISNSFMKYICVNKSKKDISPNDEIAEAIKSLNQPYIPGSSIKGAIKSAILYKEIDDDAIRTISDRILNNRGIDNRQYNKFLNKIFTSNNAPTPAQGDIMKFFWVSDTNSIKTPTLYDVATVMASYKLGNNEFYSRNKRTREKTLSFLETIDKPYNLFFEIKNNYDYDVFKRLGLENKKHLIDIENVKKSIFIFSKALISNEIEFAEDYDIKDLSEFYKNLEKENSMEKPLLRIGSGSGFLSTTIGLKIKKYDYYLYERIREGTRGKTYDYAFPKSRKITQDGGKPLGWVKLSFDEV